MTDSIQGKPCAVGARIEIPVHYDAWMQGARTGVVTSFRRGKPGQSDVMYVRMDHPQIKRPIRVWRLDWDYIKVL
jgi:hypothetical protein